MLIQERTYSPDTNSYRFGFNGMEYDNEVKGKSNSLDFGARIYDATIGRWLSTDVMEFAYPNLSPYSYSNLNPIVYIDVDGNEFINAHKKELDKAEEKLALAQKQYDELVTEFTKDGRKLRKKHKRKFLKESGLKSAQKNYDIVYQKWKEIDDLIYTLQLVNPDKYKFFNSELKDLNGETMDIIVSSAGPGQVDIVEGQEYGSHGVTSILPRITMNIDDDDFTVIGVQKPIEIKLFTSGLTYNTFGNELGDIRYFHDEVLGHGEEEYDFWIKTGNYENSDLDHYENVSGGAGVYSREYGNELSKDFKKYIKQNDIELEDHDKVNEVIYRP